MLRDRVEHFYLEKDFNCAETMLRCIDEAHALGLSEEDFTLLSGFGGGMGRGQACGALCGCIAALGKLLVDGRAHNTKGFGATCGAFVDAFQSELGGILCPELVKKYKKENVRCLEAVRKAADAFEAFYAARSGNAEK